DRGTARTHWSPDLGYESEVKSAGQSRWSPRWPVLPHRGCRSPRRLLLPQRGRWSPRWPVLPVLAVPSQPVVVPRSPPPSGKRLLFLDVHQWLARCAARRSEEHTSELQSPDHLVCRLLLEKKKDNQPA